MEFLSTIKNAIPDYAKDIRLNVDGTIARSSLEGNDAVGVALAAAFAAKSKLIIDAIRGANNIWYPYVEMAEDPDLASQPAGLRMNAYATHGGVDKRRFEMYALAASIIGKCHFCVKSHYHLLKNEQGMSAQQLRDVGRIAAVIGAAANVISAE
jgi:lipoyl-dependent peroxiredoxin subunit D